MSRLLRHLRSLGFESREGRAAEIAAWANGAASLALGGGAFAATRLWPAGVVVAVAVFVLLRLALVHRTTVWVAAVVSTLSVGVMAGAVGWLFGHVVDHPQAPPVSAALLALFAAMFPAWAFTRFARSRANDIPDSLLDPRSAPVPSSRW